MKWRKWNRLIHRDLGYIAFGLTIIYSISGIAVNHVQDWNSNYIITKDTLATPSLPDTIMTESAVESILPYLAISDSVTSYFRKSDSTLVIFFENKTASINLPAGSAIVEKVRSRPVFRESNFLHLNAPKKAWTYVADAFAIILILLAITGLFIIKGKKGITGRGLWLTLAGILLPLIFLLLYF